MVGASLVAVTARRTLAARRPLLALRSFRSLETVLALAVGRRDIRLLGSGLRLGTRCIGAVRAIVPLEATLAPILPITAIRAATTILPIVPIEAAWAILVEIAVLPVMTWWPIETLAVVLAAFAVLALVPRGAMAVLAIAVGMLALALLLTALEVGLILALVFAIVRIFDKGAVRLEAVAELLGHLLLGREQNPVIVLGVLEIVLGRNWIT